MSQEPCARCKEKGEDRRTLWMACFYEMQELGIPFKENVLLDADPKDLKKAKPPFQFEDITLKAGTVTCKGELTPQGFYTLRVCKECRADWLEAVKRWFQEFPASRTGCGSGIFVRRNGALCEITGEEWYRGNPNREPVRVR